MKYIFPVTSLIKREKTTTNNNNNNLPFKNSLCYLSADCNLNQLIPPNLSDLLNPLNRPNPQHPPNLYPHAPSPNFKES